MKSRRVNEEKALRDYLAWLIREGGAHVPFERAVARMPARVRGKTPSGLPYSPWMLLEHLRICQWDILDFSRNPGYRQMKWPEAYWPRNEAPPSAAAWTRSIAAFKRDRRAMERLVSNPKTDLYASIPWGQEQTILREALLVADHNAYHIGQLIVVRRLLGAWKD